MPSWDFCQHPTYNPEIPVVDLHHPLPVPQAPVHPVLQYVTHPPVPYPSPPQSQQQPQSPTKSEGAD